MDKIMLSRARKHMKSAFCHSTILCNYKYFRVQLKRRHKQHADSIIIKNSNEPIDSAPKVILLSDSRPDNTTGI